MATNFKSFKSLREYLNDVPFINCGGCGYSAFFIYEFLKSKDKKPEIAFIYDGGNDNFDTNEAILKKHENLKPSSCAHAVVKVGEFAYDSSGIHKWQDTLDQWSEGNDLYHIVTEDFLLKALANRIKWNDMFDRDQEVPVMEKKIGLNLPTS